MNELIAAMDWVHTLHDPSTFNMWLSTGGVMLVTAIIFAETGLLLGFFLPGDSLLITAGVLANPVNPSAIPGLSIFTLALCLSAAAIFGDQLGFFLGKKTGEKIFTREEGLFFKKEYVVRAKAFYERYGVAAIIACRFIPILRTFVPFIAGVSQMKYSRFLKWDIFGGLLWINSLLTAGFFLGASQYANRLDKIIVIVIIVSVLPMVIGALKKTLEGRTA